MSLLENVLKSLKNKDSNKLVQKEQINTLRKC